MSQLPAIGVDLGSKYLCFGIWEGDRGEILANEEGKRTTAALDGEEANTYAVYVKALNKAVSTCKEILGSDDIHDEVVIGVPTHYNDSQRRTISNAIRDVIQGGVGMKNENMCAAPILAAIAYGLENKPAGTVIFVFHLGARTCTASLIRIQETICFDVSDRKIDDSVFEEVAAVADTRLGGDYFDERVVNHVIEKLKNHNGVEICGNERALSRVKAAVEKAKRALSFSCMSEVVVDGVLDGEDLQMYVTRPMFEELNKDLFLKCIDTVESCMEKAKLHKNDVDEVVVMGGSSRIPKLQELLANFFIGKELRNSIAPDEVVAYGATVRGGALAGFHPQNIGNLSPSRLSMLHGLLHDYMKLDYMQDDSGDAFSHIIDVFKKYDQIPIKDEEELRVVNRLIVRHQFRGVVVIYHEDKSTFDTLKSKAEKLGIRVARKQDRSG